MDTILRMVSIQLKQREPENRFKIFFEGFYGVGLHEFLGEADYRLTDIGITIILHGTEIQIALDDAVAPQHLVVKSKEINMVFSIARQVMLPQDERLRILVQKITEAIIERQQQITPDNLPKNLQGGNQA